MDTMKLASGRYQCTCTDDCADDCMRYLVAALYPRRTAANILDFLEPVFDVIPLPIPRLQTDQGMEFMAYNVRDEQFALRLKHRPIPPRSPDRNDQVERVQQTMLTACLATRTFDSPSLAEDLPSDCWPPLPARPWLDQEDVAAALRRVERADPSWEDVAEAFDSVKEVTGVDRLTLRRHTIKASK